MKENPEKKFHGLFSAKDLIEQSIINPSRPQDIKNQAHALGTFDALEDLHKIQKETLIICAEKDRQTPKIMNEKIHEEIPNSKLIVVEGAGHDSPKERAPEVNQYIVDFLKN
jgi:pimeloyl-ACP methyl ester carboxylesterase